MSTKQTRIDDMVVMAKTVQERITEAQQLWTRVRALDPTVDATRIAWCLREARCMAARIEEVGRTGGVVVRGTPVPVADTFIPAGQLG